MSVEFIDRILTQNEFTPEDKTRFYKQVQEDPEFRDKVIRNLGLNKSPSGRKLAESAQHRKDHTRARWNLKLGTWQLITQNPGQHFRSKSNRGSSDELLDRLDRLKP